MYTKTYWEWKNKFLFAIPEHNKQMQKLSIFITLFKRILLVKQQRFIKELFIHVLPSIFITDSCNHKGLALHCISGACSSFLGFAILGKYFYTDHPCEYFKMFLFALKFILSFSVFFGCYYFIPFYVLYNWIIEKRDSSSIGISTSYMFQRVQKVVFQGGNKITYDFFQTNATNCIC